MDPPVGRRSLCRDSLSYVRPGLGSWQSGYGNELDVLSCCLCCPTHCNCVRSTYPRFHYASAAPGEQYEPMIKNGFRNTGAQPGGHGSIQTGRLPRVGRPRLLALLNRLIRDVVGTTFQQVAEYLDREHQNEYPAALSKNLRKCERLVENFVSSPPTKQGFLNLS